MTTWWLMSCGDLDIIGSPFHMTIAIPLFSSARWPSAGSVSFVAFWPHADSRIPSDTLIADLQYRMRCRQCRRNKGLRI